MFDHISLDISEVFDHMAYDHMTMLRRPVTIESNSPCHRTHTLSRKEDRKKCFLGLFYHTIIPLILQAKQLCGTLKMCDMQYCLSCGKKYPKWSNWKSCSNSRRNPLLFFCIATRRGFGNVKWKILSNYCLFFLPMLLRGSEFLATRVALHFTPRQSVSEWVIVSD